MSRQKRPNYKRQFDTYAKYSGIALQMIVVICLGSFGGLKLDEMFPNKFHAFTIIGSLAAIGIAMYLVIKRVGQVSKNQNSSDG